MKTIWKYPLKLTDHQTIKVPEYGKPIHFGYQSYQLTVWCEVESDNSLYDIKFYIVGTGNQRPVLSTKYVGTCISHPFVWHLYWRET